MTQSQTAGRPLPWDEKAAKGSQKQPVFDSRVSDRSLPPCLRLSPLLTAHPLLGTTCTSPGSKRQATRKGKPARLVKTKTYLNCAGFPQSNSSCRSQRSSSISPPWLLTGVWPKPSAAMLCERMYRCHTNPGQQQPAMATPSRKQLKKEPTKGL